VIFFQGDKDPIVLPDQTEKMVRALWRRKIPCGYLLFTAENHGFKKGFEHKRALDAELYFYSAQCFARGHMLTRDERGCLASLHCNGHYWNIHEDLYPEPSAPKLKHHALLIS
jgi:hypothetical protein